MMNKKHSRCTACLAKDAVKMLAGRWKLLILREVCDGPRHFGELRRALGVSQKVLAQQLRQMETHGIIRRRVIPGRVTQVEYSLTREGESLRSIIATLHEWAEKKRRQRSKTAGGASNDLEPSYLVAWRYAGFSGCPAFDFSQAVLSIPAPGLRSFRVN